MAHFAILCPEDISHVLVSGAIGKELVGRGHRVTVVAPAGAAAAADEFGLPLYPLNDDAIPYRADIPLWSAFRLWGAQSYIQLRSWLCWYAEMILQLAAAGTQELAVDGVLVDQTISAGGTAAQRAACPLSRCAPRCSGTRMPACRRRLPPGPMRAMAGPNAAIGWATPAGIGLSGRFSTGSTDIAGGGSSRGFPRSRTRILRWHRLASCVRSSIFARRRLPDVFHYVGSLVANRRMKTECPFPWEWLDGRPLIFASLGTVPDNYNLPVFRKILAACAGIDAQLVLTLGAWEGEDEQVRAKLGEIPAQRLGRRLRAAAGPLGSGRGVDYPRRSEYGAGIAQPGRAHRRPAAAPISRRWGRGSRMPEWGFWGPSAARPPGRFENWSSGFCRKRRSGNGPKRCRRPWPRRAGFAARQRSPKGPFLPAGLSHARKPLSRGTPPRQLEAGLMKGSRFVEELVAARGCGAAVTEFVCTTPPVCAAARRSQEPAASGGCNLSFSKVAEAGIEPARG